MRIIAGYDGGRTFESPSGNRTHPMSEKIRGALFNALGDIKGLTVLDAYAGSGALSFEALSRGARRATAIDADKSAYDVILRNARSIGVTKRIKIIRANAASWSDNNHSERFDLVLLDPPYDNVVQAQLSKLATHVTPGGLVVCSLPPNIIAELPTDTYELVSSKDYGDATLSFYRHT